MGAIVGTVSLDMYSEFIFRELTLIASQQPRNPVQDSIYYHLTGQRNRRTLLEMIREGSVNTQDLITHRFSYAEAPAVYRRLGEAKAADYDAEGNVNRDMIGVLFNWQE
jgi:threonine dehydrogenase-like Zn-dependent dehydrogenase